MTGRYEPTSRTTATRARERMFYEREAAHAILDQAYDCSVAFVVDGEPRVLPTLHVRVADTIYLHASSGSRLGLTARGEGIRVAVSVTLLDGLVFARSQFHHSANYRSLVALGVARLVTDETEKKTAMTALVERTAAGRSAESRPPTPRELATTAVLALPLTEVSVRVRAAGVVDDPEDVPLPHWAGVLPLRRVLGPPEPAEGVSGPPPAYLPQAPASPWLTAAPMRGQHVALEPLAPSHVDGLLTALADDEVWQFLPSRRPATRAQMAEHVAIAERQRWEGSRVAWAQCDPATGEVIGMTSYHDVNENDRSLGIGHTMIGRRWWRSGVNTEAKFLLLERAFEVLGAERVFWYTDIRNERSQRAIARLGASRDGLIRRQRLRPDGTWRDTVLFAMTADEWPAARDRLAARLRQGSGAPAPSA
ncbi:bifunctional pyridoxamine 5'-phosphate oxidase family protein/GNAT family N-acetyltransferase [Actinoplanes sp. NPDC051494]|uniref:bifunctional pyridoxamine 5'-phosphate oxidase family protein/GNAT family N-acetyltransferase n=1 Tax=Actinoplanes sp. NPDC051494 TaxID=3363907 RepID=UPI0037A27823